MDLVRTPYTEVLGKHRPYLLVGFLNSEKENLEKEGTVRLSLLDSGADSIVIPFSLGEFLDLEKARPEEFSRMTGVGGLVSYIKRKCTLVLFDDVNKEYLLFRQEVMWMHPDPDTQHILSTLKTEYENLQSAVQQAISGTDLEKFLDTLVEQKKNEILVIQNQFEMEVLLGRDFFENFDFIQFLHRDSQREEKCSFNYVIKNKKIYKRETIES